MLGSTRATSVRHMARVAMPRLAPAVPKRRQLQVVCVPASHGKPGKGENPVEVLYSIHGRHMDIDDTMRMRVIERLQPVVDKLRGGTVLEAEGGLGEVDVGMMPTSCHITLRALKGNKHLHDTFLRQGELQAIVTEGNGAWDCFSRCVEQVEHKLKPITKPTPLKVDYRSKGDHTH